MKIFRFLSNKIVIGIALLLLLSATVFAAQTELELTTKVDPINELKITHGLELPTLLTWETIDITSELTELDTSVVSNLHLHLMTNLRKVITIMMTIPDLTSDESSWRIPYTLTLADSSGSFTSDDGENQHTFAEYPAAAIEGRTILTTSFSLQLNSSAYENAIAGTYDAVISFEIITD